jgi:hypothetical protein
MINILSPAQFPYTNMLYQKESQQVHRKSIFTMTKRKQSDWVDITVCKIRK